MQGETQVAADAWGLATFPNRGQLCKFVEELRIWNGVEGLPQIHFEVLADGLRMRFWSEESRRQGVQRYIDSFGAWVQSDD